MMYTSPVNSLPSRKIWLIGFSFQVNQIFEMSFSQSEYQLEIHYSCQEAWLKLNEGNLCDCMFINADKPGFELVQKLQQNLELNSIPLVLAGMRISHMPWNCSTSKSSYPNWMKQLVEEFRQQEQYFTLPYLDEDLFSVVRKLLRSQ